MAPPTARPPSNRHLHHRAGDPTRCIMPPISGRRIEKTAKPKEKAPAVTPRSQCNSSKMGGMKRENAVRALTPIPSLRRRRQRSTSRKGWANACAGALLAHWRGSLAQGLLGTGAAIAALAPGRSVWPCSPARRRRQSAPKASPSARPVLLACNAIDTASYAPHKPAVMTYPINERRRNVRPRPRLR